MDDAIRRAVERQFPELTGGYHLPRFARVIAVADAPADAGLCDDFRPRYAVDIEVLGADDEPDPAMPPLTGVPLPLPTGGEEMGIYAFPEEGTRVVVCFAYGLPNKPYIQSILPHGLSMPKVPKGDQVWQHSEAAQQRVDADGNWLRQTDGKIRDQAIEREVEALDNREQFQSHTQTIDDHSTETVGGVKKIEALGALKLMSGGSASLAAVDDLHQATGRDLNMVVGQKHHATVGGDMHERIEGLRKSVSLLSQKYESPKTWIGSDATNILVILHDTLDTLSLFAVQIAEHTHADRTLPVSSQWFRTVSQKFLGMSEELGEVTIFN
ncbi:DUF2345 domain-containing protein [Pseudomonas siliginis]|uniref:DUF2345 domain-containing protein n=1 Tax=Pseudomonas siliginis TaxID=2842346 RepID=UPI00209279F3|nr:DUF2345 domain-containing protein [Pseudomonas siliginis]UST80142.1 DUF2345 domain-containing protein [Pseudomonas siliginis]